MKRIIHNFFHENRSTLNGLVLIAIAIAVHRFGGLDSATEVSIVGPIAALAIKFLTGSDSGSKPPQTNA